MNPVNERLYCDVAYDKARVAAQRIYALTDRVGQLRRAYLLELSHGLPLPSRVRVIEQLLILCEGQYGIPLERIIDEGEALYNELEER